MIRETNEGWSIIDGDTHMGKWVESMGKLDHDEFTIPLACEYIPEGGVAIDCGANIGCHSVGYANKLGKEGILICIEAGKKAYECLLKNAEKFPCEVFTFRGALGNKDNGFCDFIEDPNNFGASEVRRFEGKGEKVQHISIDGLLSKTKLERLDFIKIDCEGSEPDIIEGGYESIMKFKPVLLIEVNWPKLRSHDKSPTDIYFLLADLKYSWKIIQPEASHTSEQFDILCMPVGRTMDLQ